MKKIISLLLPVMLLAICFSSCEFVPITETETFDASLLTGKWNSGTLYYKYMSNGTGTTWDTADDVSEDEAQAFNWTLDEDDLVHIYIMETGGTGIPKVYTLTALTATTLKYKDDFKSYTFTKVLF